MSSAAEEIFKTYDFSSNASWQDYLNNLYPTPTHDKLLKIKRKWFKKNVDSNLDVDAGISPEEENRSTPNTSNTNTSSNSNNNDTSDSARQRQTNPQSSQNSQDAQGSQGQNLPGGFLGKIVNVVGTPLGKLLDLIYGAALPMKDTFYFTEGIMKLVFIISIFLLPAYANMIAFNVCLLGFFRQTGRPKWDVVYGKRALENEFLQNILFMVPFTFFPNQKTLVYFLPLAIHFWIGFCEFANLRLPQIYPKIAKAADFTRQNRANLMFQKAKIEIMLFVFIIILLFVGSSNLILIIFYGNFLKTKYLINPSTKGAFQELNNWVEGKISSPYCPGVVRVIAEKIRSLCAYLVKP